MDKDVKQLSELEKRLNSSVKKNVTSQFRRWFFLLLQQISRFVTRIFELILGIIMFVGWTMPLLVFVLLRRVFTGKAVFVRKLVYGQKGQPMTLWYFNFERYYLRNSFLFFYVLIGRLRLIGISIKEFSSGERSTGDACLFEDKPGIFNLWFLRDSSRIGHEGKKETEWEYIFKRSLFSDFMLLIKSIPAALYHVSSASYQDWINLFGVDFCNLTMREAVALIKQVIEQKERKKIYFMNPDCFNKCFSDENYFELLHKGDYIFPDGIGVHIACKMIGTPLKENVNGTDMLPFLCEMLRENGYSMFLLGGKPGIAATMKRNLEDKYPGLNIVGEQNGYFNRETEQAAVIERINELDPDILLVAFGVPIQEQWIESNFGKLNCRVVMGVGGLFDFYSGNIKRAPRWLREIGFEWSFRLLMEPRRMFKRYIIGNPVFICRLLRWKKRRDKKGVK